MSEEYKQLIMMVDSKHGLNTLRSNEVKYLVVNGRWLWNKTAEFIQERCMEMTT